MRTVLAIVLSVLFHGLIAGALIAYIEYGPPPAVLATLDLSSVELSFSEQEVDNAAAAPMPSVSPQPSLRPKSAEEPAAEDPPLPMPPDPDAPGFPEPKEAMPRLETPEPIAQSQPELPPSQPQESAPAAPAPRQARIDAPPKPRRNIKSEYPKGSRQRGEQGNVVLEIRVNESGTVEDVKVVGSSGFSELDSAAVKAARSARFVPAKSGEKAVTSTVRLTLAFKLRD